MGDPSGFVGPPVESASDAPCLERLAGTCTSAGGAAVEVPWEVALRAPVQGRPERSQGRLEAIWGIDWGTKVLAVCAVDEEGKRLFEEEITRSGDAIERMVRRVLAEAEGDPSQVFVALELPRASVIEAFLARGAHVFSINPKQVDRFRDRHTVAGAKDDALDAYVLADALRTDRKLFRALEPEEEALVILRERSRACDDLTRQVKATASQIQAVLQRYYPELAGLGRWHEEPWLWALFELAPTPQKLRKLHPKKVERHLEKSRIQRKGVHQSLQRARETKPLPTSKAVTKACAERIQRLLPILRAAHHERRQCQSDLRQLVHELASVEEDDEPSDMAILLSFPGIGYRVAAVLRAEAWMAIGDRDSQALRRLSGTAPVSKRSGGRSKRPQVSMRRACHTRISNAVRYWASVAIQHDDRAAALYQACRARGHNYSRALRTVADRLLPVLIAALRNRTLYRPQLRRHSVA